MREDVLGQRQSSRHQHRGPQRRVEADEDVLGHHVDVRRPVLPEPRPVVRVSGTGEVVDESVHPYVDYRALGARDELREGCAPGGLPAHTDVLETALDEADDLVSAELRKQEAGVLLDVGQQPFGVAGEAEEVGGLTHPLDRLAALGVGAAPLHQLLFPEVGLVRDAVPALIGVEIEIAALVERLEERLHGTSVAFLGGLDEVVVSD